MKNPKATYIDIDKLIPFEGHPFYIRDDDEMDRLQWSICTEGILTPITVRPVENGEYEIISGHRRVHACKKAGITKIPALIVELDKDAAAIAVVDSNLHREHILPSEKAFAYKLKLEAVKHQGERTDLTSRQDVGKLESADMISDTESGRQVQRYIRLTLLIKTLLRLVDEGRIALTPAVELSYLTEDEQICVYEFFKSNEVTPSYAQAVKLKKFSEEGELNSMIIERILSEPKPNQQDRISFKTEDLKAYVPAGYTNKDINELIISLLKQWHRQKIRERSSREER